MIIPKEQIMWEVFCKFKQGYKLLDHTKRWQQPNGEEMTDKEIIINGVDVSKCDYLRYDHIGCDIDQTYCLGNDCSYKQLKRKEQALDEIENYVRDNSDFDKSDKLTSDTGAYDILDIINKAKDGE